MFGSSERRIPEKAVAGIGGRISEHTMGTKIKIQIPALKEKKKRKNERPVKNIQ